MPSPHGHLDDRVEEPVGEPTVLAAQQMPPPWQRRIGVPGHPVDARGGLVGMNLGEVPDGPGVVAVSLAV
jgi:hypothetical protein